MLAWFRAVMFFGLITSSVASETSDVLADAASFAVTIQQQFEMLVGDPAPAELAEKAIDYATAKTAYFNALRAEVSELIDIATSKETRPPGVDIFVAAFVVAGEISTMPVEPGVQRRKCSGLSPKTIDASGVFC
jgi:hypothetical protein